MLTNEHFKPMPNSDTAPDAASEQGSASRAKVGSTRMTKVDKH